MIQFEFFSFFPEKFLKSFILDFDSLILKFSIKKAKLVKNRELPFLRLRCPAAKLKIVTCYYYFLEHTFPQSLAFQFQTTQFIHAVEKISFISRDTTDRRAFGYIVEGEKGQFHFFGLKTGNAAEGLVLALRDLFQVVYDIKQKEKNGGDTQATQAMENLQQVSDFPDF